MIEDGDLREIAVNWQPASNAQVREMALELLKAREVVRAASDYTANLGMTHHWRCPQWQQDSAAECTCSGQKLWDAIAVLENP